MITASALKEEMQAVVASPHILETKKKLTYYDLQNGLPDGHYEIIDGEVKEVTPTGFLHGKWEGEIYSKLKEVLNDKGFLAVGEVGILISKEPLRIRGADVVFVSKEKLDKEPEGILEIAPDLVIEIVSPANTMSEMELKIRDYLKIGVEKIILIYPVEGNVTVYSHDGQIEFLTLEDEIEVFKGVKVKLG